MSWFFIAIFSYFLLAIVSLIDKYLLGGELVSPKTYAFYVGILGIFAFLLTPLGFFIPSFSIIILALTSGILHILAIFVLFKAIQLFEVSRIIPAIGGLLPIFVFGLTFLLPIEKETLSFFELMAFLLLVLGSVIITYERKKLFSLKSFGLTFLASFLFSLYFVFAKIVYLSHPFISGFIWTRIGAFLAAIIFLFSREVKSELLNKKESSNPKTLAILIPNQVMAAIAFLLQNWAVSLVPLGLLAFVNALEGTRFVFLLIFSIFLSVKFPQILKEEISKKIIFQKIVAILLISSGLILLAGR